MKSSDAGVFREYRDEGAVGPDAMQAVCPLAMRGLPSIYSGTEITDLYDLAAGGLSATMLMLQAKTLLDVIACQMIAYVTYVCTQPQDLLLVGAHVARSEDPSEQ